jgi:hypothetical protein
LYGLRKTGRRRHARRPASRSARRLQQVKPRRRPDIPRQLRDDRVARARTRIVQIAEAKTIANEALGATGTVSVFVKATLCNWLVCLGVVMAMTSTSTIGKIAAAWLPIVTFFAQGFEHAVVNMFIIPTGMLMGAKISVYQWWVWNQIPVTLGNIVGGFLFTRLALYATLQAGNADDGGFVGAHANSRRITRCAS